MMTVSSSPRHRAPAGDVPVTVALNAAGPVALVPVDQREEAPL